MQKHKTLKYGSLLLALLAPSALAEPAPSGRISIISPSDLSTRSSITVLDCRPSVVFRQGRIPGSQHVDWKEWARERADVFGLWFGKGGLAGLVKPPSEELQAELRKLGISNSKLVVVVGEPGHWGEEGRIAWNLLYWGHEDVALLDGGFPAWQKMFPDAAETGDIVRPEKGDFTFRLRPERRVDLEQVRQVIEDRSRPIIDNRSIEEFQGKKWLGQKRGGHIPGAISVPVDHLYRQDGSYLDETSLKNLVLTNESIPIAYCVGGVRSALFAMLWEARLNRLVANYDGSIWEWSSRPELPLQ